MMTSFLPEQQKQEKPTEPPITVGSNVRPVNPTEEMADATGQVHSIGYGPPKHRTIGVAWQVKGKRWPAQEHDESELVNVD